MMMMQYTDCVVKAHKVQTVKLTLYKYKSWSHTAVFNRGMCRLV